MLISTILTPSLHGTLGVQDEIVLLASPLIVLITIVTLKLWRGRTRFRSDRVRSRAKTLADRRASRPLHKG